VAGVGPVPEMRGALSSACEGHAVARPAKHATESTLAISLQLNGRMPTHTRRIVRARYFFVALMAISSFDAAPASAQQRRSPPVLVRRVIDGATIDVVSVGRVRLLGVAAPKPTTQSNQPGALALEAQQRLSGLLANRWVRLEFETGAEGKSSHAAYVFLDDGRFVNEWLVREGLGRVTGGTGLSRLGALQRAEREARAARRGMWAGADATTLRNWRISELANW
jgi:endonuclease YncB( thermonuclease family)